MGNTATGETYRMFMNFISLFSGIEAASVAFKPLGWKPVAFSEIEPFPCAVLKHYYPEVPNLGDITKVDWSKWRGKADLVCGGSPCQAFSIAGLRGGLSDERGNLTLEFSRAVIAIRPRFVLWENVPGVLSDKKNAFGCFLAALSGADGPLMPGTEDGRWRSAGIVSGPGYGLAWRVLNAEFFGVPQSRRRVFLVGYFGNWRTAAQVLFEPKMLRGDIAAGGEKEKATTGDAGSGTQAIAGKMSRIPALNCNHEAPIIYENYRRDSRIKEVNTLPQINANAGTGGGNPPLVMAFKQRPEGDIIQSERVYNISTTSNASAANTAKIHCGMTIRRLTPLECERAQGFPDNYTRIPYKGKTAEKCPDSPRYKAIGNSWAVPCARWIGQRIEAVDKILQGGRNGLPREKPDEI